jgi:hypothetical protein
VLALSQHHAKNTFEVSRFDHSPSRWSRSLVMSSQLRAGGIRTLVRLSERTAREYQYLSAHDPEEINALEIRYLRLSPLPAHRQVAVRLWAIRRPDVFLRAAAGFFKDADPEVRASVIEGLAIVAAGYDRTTKHPTVAPLLEQATADPAKEVREAVEVARKLLEAEDV